MTKPASLFFSLVSRRPGWSFWAVVCGSLFCAVRNHVHVVLWEPGSYADVVHHRCGLLLLACVVWASCEVVGARLRERSNRRGERALVYRFGLPDGAGEGV